MSPLSQPNSTGALITGAPSNLALFPGTPRGTLPTTRRIGELPASALARRDRRPALLFPASHSSPLPHNPPTCLIPFRLRRRIGEVVGTSPGAVKPQDKDKASPRRGMSSPQARLFAGGIQPTDICQGALGEKEPHAVRVF